MQLLGIYIYGRNGKRRDILLRPGNLNIISGASKTGKSALIDIVEYCLGAGECRVPPGTIRDAAVWYGILLQLAEVQLFIARADPGEKRSSTEIYYELATTVEIPALQGLRQNINTDGLIDLLTQKSGIGENQHEVEPGNTRLPLEANIKHALKFCIQRQDEIARRSQLFHSQDDPYISQALKDSLPYFLGVVNDERLHAQAELRRLTAVERALQREVSEAALPIESETPIARLLLAEAQDVGLARAESIDSSDELVGVLRRSVASDDVDESLDEDASSGMRILRREREELTSQYRLQRERLALLTGFSSERDSYVAEVTDQMGRLGPATVFPRTHSVLQCPLCSSPISDDIPSVSELQARLEELRSQIGAIQETRPRIDSRINELSLGVERLRLKLRSNHQAIVRLTEQQDELMLQRPLHLRQSHVKGRISLYLESIDSAPDPVSELNERLRDLRTSIERLRQELAMTDVVQRLASALNIVGTDMTQLANELDFEFRGEVLRLDLQRLMVVADRITGPIEMRQMGSGANWIACHIVAHLALHRWFVTQDRPVPRFLFLDQPTQVYYPPEQDQDGRLDALQNEDQMAVKDLFAMLFAFAEALAPKLQIIVLDHAYLDDERFQASVVETWRGGQKLIPLDWITPA